MQRMNCGAKQHIERLPRPQNNHNLVIATGINGWNEKDVRAADESVQ